LSSFSRVLYVDLTESSSRVVDRSELFKKYLGGAGVASKLLLEEAPPKIDPFSPNSPVIFAASCATAVFPSIDKAVAVFKSPLTKNLGESHAAGYFATALRLAGYGALVIKGASEHPTLLRIHDGDVEIKKASSLWGLSPLDVERALGESDEPGLRSTVACGVAGEHYVHFSNLIVDRYHHFGRLGLGAIFGSKRLKAVSVIGSEGIDLANPLAVKDLYKTIYDQIVGTDVMVKYHDYGTPGNMAMLNELGALPTKNFKETRFEGAEKISGEVMAEVALDRKISCPSCPIACIHLADLETDFRPEHERGRREVFKERELVPYNYEPMYALGSNLMVEDAQGLLRLIAECERLGLDAMTAGTLLGWATEAFENGLITEGDTGGLRPRWGDVETYLKMLDCIAYTVNPFYVKMAQGIDAVAEKYGGREYALSIGGNGPAGYMIGYGSVAGPLVGLRHSHVSNSGYSFDQKNLGRPMNPEELADYLIEHEDWLYVLYSLGVCYFARNVYTKERVVEVLAALGVEYTPEDLMKLGGEVVMNLYRYKVREGFDLKDIRIPRRFFEPQTPWGRLDEEKMRQIITLYVKKRELKGVKIRAEDKALLDLLKPQG